MTSNRDWDRWLKPEPSFWHGRANSGFTGYLYSLRAQNPEFPPIPDLVELWRLPPEDQGCPNGCGQYETDTIIEHLARTPEGKIVAHALQCVRCQMIWGAAFIPIGEHWHHIGAGSEAVHCFHHDAMRCRQREIGKLLPFMIRWRGPDHERDSEY